MSPPQWWRFCACWEPKNKNQNSCEGLAAATNQQTNKQTYKHFIFWGFFSGNELRIESRVSFSSAICRPSAGLEKGKRQRSGWAIELLWLKDKLTGSVLARPTLCSKTEKHIYKTAHPPIPVSRYFDSELKCIACTHARVEKHSFWWGVDCNLNNNHNRELSKIKSGISIADYIMDSPWPFQCLFPVEWPIYGIWEPIMMEHECECFMAGESTQVGLGVRSTALPIPVSGYLRSSFLSSESFSPAHK